MNMNKQNEVCSVCGASSLDTDPNTCYNKVDTVSELNGAFERLEYYIVQDIKARPIQAVMAVVVSCAIVFSVATLLGVDWWGV